MDAEMRIDYDTNSDVLYLSYGEPREAISDEITDGVLVRRDFETDEVVGVTILDFLYRFKNHPSAITLPFGGAHHPAMSSSSDQT